MDDTAIESGDDDYQDAPEEQGTPVAPTSNPASASGSPVQPVNHVPGRRRRKLGKAPLSRTVHKYNRVIALFFVCFNFHNRFAFSLAASMHAHKLTRVVSIPCFMQSQEWYGLNYVPAGAEGRQYMTEEDIVDYLKYRVSQGNMSNSKQRGEPLQPVCIYDWARAHLHL